MQHLKREERTIYVKTEVQTVWDTFISVCVSVDSDDSFLAQAAEAQCHPAVQCSNCHSNSIFLNLDTTS